MDKGKQEDGQSRQRGAWRCDQGRPARGGGDIYDGLKYKKESAKPQKIWKRTFQVEGIGSVKAMRGEEAAQVPKAADVAGQGGGCEERAQ